MMHPRMMNTMRRAAQRFVGLSLLLVLVVGVVTAQTGNGQICLSAFEDSNSNQLKDQGEAPITQDIVATLADAENVIVQSLLLNDSPQAASGVMCFQSLAAGQYTLTAKSANYDATTNASFLTAVDTSGNIQRFDYGGKLAISAAPAQTAETGVLTPARQSALIERLLFSSIGALVAIAILGFLGILVYWMGFRLPPRSQVMPYKRGSTGSYPAVNYAAPVPGQYTPAPPMRPVDPATGQLRNVAPLPPVEVPPASFDDTGPIKTVRTSTDLSGSSSQPAPVQPTPQPQPAPLPPPIINSGDWSPDDPLPPEEDEGRYRPKRD
jgi:hypothetical protein